MFDDDLLQRGRGMMTRSKKAEALRGPLKALLSGVQVLVDPPEIALQDICQTVRLIIADHVAALLLPPLMHSLAQTAPGIDLLVRPWRGARGARADLLSGDADLALSIFDREIDGLERQHILTEHYAVIMRRGHPASASFNLDQWLAWPHILVSGTGDRGSPLDAQLERIGKARRIGLVVPSFQIVPDLLLASDLIAMLPAHSIPADLADRLDVHDVPITVEGFDMHLGWPIRLRDDKAVQHVRMMLADLLLAHIAPQAAAI
jgi:DNA-binding transcriptional LysR family regulator